MKLISAPLLRAFWIAFLIAVCFASALLVLPGINRHLDNPNLIVYFNADEGYLMDLAWYYYSGQVRDSFQTTLDYGLEMVYLAKFCHIVISKYIVFSPGTFVAILRWIHLLSWIAALICLWRLIGRHFHKGIEQAAIVGLLAVSPSFGYFMNSLKPDPLVLLVIVLGIDYTLRMVSTPRVIYFIAVVIFSSIGFVVKFSGIFLLPVLVAALYYSRQASALEVKWFSGFRIKRVWVLPIIASGVLLALPLLVIFLYVRKTSGMTYFQEFGLWQAFLRYKVAFGFFAISLGLAGASFAMYLMSRTKRNFLQSLWEKVEILGSYSVLVFIAFVLVSLIVAFGWILMPGHFLETYFLSGMDFSGGEVLKGIKDASQFGMVYLLTLKNRFSSLDPLVLTFFAVYVVIECYFRGILSWDEEVMRRKRMVLIVFLMPFFLMMFTLGRFTNHHALIFTIFMSLLAVEGILILMAKSKMKSNVRFAIFAVFTIFFIFDFCVRADAMIRERKHKMAENEDVCFEAEKWMKANLPKDAKVLTDYHTMVYVPLYLDNVKSLKCGNIDRLTQMRMLAEEFKTRYLYYNEGSAGDTQLPPIEEIFKDRKTKLIVSFDSEGRRFQRRAGDKFVIYELLD